MGRNAHDRSGDSVVDDVDDDDFNLRETRPSLGGGRIIGNDRGTAFDMVEQMEYLYVRVVKARELPNNAGDVFVEVKLGGFKSATKSVSRPSRPEWNQVFSMQKDHIQAPFVEISLKDKSRINAGDDSLGTVVFDASDVPKRVPPDSPLAPEWYRLDNRRHERVAGELMLAVWMGTQADEAFPDAYHLDNASSLNNGDGVMSIRSKVYLSPRLWYLRVNVIEAQELLLHQHHHEVFVKALIGNTVVRTKASQSSRTTPKWNEDLMFTVGEPFEDQLVLHVEERVGPNKDEHLGQCSIPLQCVEKRADSKPLVSRWYALERHSVSENGQKRVVKLSGRIHLRVSLDGGYHVLDELTHYSSDLRPTARQLWKPSIGVLELGILSGRNLTPMKIKDGCGSTDAYCVAKYGQKWIRTRTIINSFNPKWNEQYTWEVFDPCTVITIGVFDNSHGGGSRDTRVGKVRIRLSALEMGRIYTHMYPLMVLSPCGVKKMGEVQLAVRFSGASLFSVLSIYAQPLLPELHYTQPLGFQQIEVLRHQATQIVSSRLGRAEPPLRKEVVEYMLDVGSSMWSVRRSKSNHFRLATVVSGVARCVRVFDGICSWSNPMVTVSAHVLFLVCVCFPWLIAAAAFVCLFAIGTWNYRSRPRHPPHTDVRLSQADAAQADELEEEFDAFPTAQRQVEVLRARYDRLRAVASRAQAVLGDVATQGERVAGLLSWRDPRATSLFMMFCVVACAALCVVSGKVMVVAFGFHAMRHPKFRKRMPAAPVNFLRRLPARTDCLL
ncbi:hypothetical protein M569_07043 [Genlisea aurea]|uniref:C2 domain-containing protein n=1 Tax=Genlisea aurea TaxID=192259 RepID=S8CLW4_9LAMI|nr:hypothetical protein M569_07043 [Genlisea aurea]